VEKIRIYQGGGRPERLADGCKPFFDQRTGNPVCWYSRRGGTIELFNLMGFHPESGDELKPVTREIVAAWQTQPRKVPKLIEASISMTYFHPVTGAPLVWFRRTESGEYEFYDAKGFHPITGEPLEPVTRENVAQIRKVIAEASARIAEASKPNCFILTSESVRYGQTPGLDPSTGRLCRPFTEGLLERLKEYEKGRRPTLINDKKPVMFDPRSGEPIVWYWRAPGGTIELYDLMGFHSRTGDELLPITKVIADEYTTQVLRPTEPPKPVNLTTGTQCFDPNNGNPKCWYAKGRDGLIEFFDAPGFHPTFGYPLAVVSVEVIEELLEAGRKRAAAEVQAAKRLEDERAKQEREREEKRSQAGMVVKTCDDLAANPTDRNRVGPGVAHPDLRNNAREAQRVCKQAMEQEPSQLRLRYQYARALAFDDRQAAMRIFQSLASARYAAAFDNLGWKLLETDKAAAVAVFRSGVALGDPDSMVSLAEMYIRGFAAPRSEAETKIALYVQACQLGHTNGCKAAEIERQSVSHGGEGGKMSPEDVSKIFGTFINLIPRKNR